MRHRAGESATIPRLQKRTGLFGHCDTRDHLASGLAINAPGEQNITNPKFMGKLAPLRKERHARIERNASNIIGGWLTHRIRADRRTKQRDLTRLHRTEIIAGGTETSRSARGKQSGVARAALTPRRASKQALIVSTVIISTVIIAAVIASATLAIA
jgi:hypothetical protein